MPPRTAMRCRVWLLHPHTRIDGTISTGFDRLFPHCEDAVVRSSHYLHALVLGAHQKRRREDRWRGAGERWPGDVMAMMRLCMCVLYMPALQYPFAKLQPVGRQGSSFTTTGRSRYWVTAHRTHRCQSGRVSHSHCQGFPEGSYRVLASFVAPSICCLSPMRLPQLPSSTPGVLLRPVDLECRPPHHTSCC